MDMSPIPEFLRSENPAQPRYHEAVELFALFDYLKAMRWGVFSIRESLQAVGECRDGTLQGVHLSITSVELVRGALATAHAFASAPVSEKDLWRAFRTAYGSEPFVRIVREKQGVYRLPEPKILAGSNYADVGFAIDEETGRIVSICAIDNLMKGAAGTAVQCMNLMCGFEERTGLEFPGLHPI